MSTDLLPGVRVSFILEPSGSHVIQDLELHVRQFLRHNVAVFFYIGYNQFGM